MKLTDEHIEEFKERLFKINAGCWDSVDDIEMDDHRFDLSVSLFMLEKQLEEIADLYRITSDKVLNLDIPTRIPVE
jgi:hypothetical protein